MEPESIGLAEDGQAPRPALELPVTHGLTAAEYEAKLYEWINVFDSAHPGLEPRVLVTMAQAAAEHMGFAKSVEG